MEYRYENDLVEETDKRIENQNQQKLSKTKNITMRLCERQMKNSSYYYGYGNGKLKDYVIRQDKMKYAKNCLVKKEIKNTAKKEMKNTVKKEAIKKAEKEAGKIVIREGGKSLIKETGKTLIMSGSAEVVGAAIGTSVAPVVGTLVGAGVGYVFDAADAALEAPRLAKKEWIKKIQTKTVINQQPNENYLSNYIKSLSKVFFTAIKPLLLISGGVIMTFLTMFLPVFLIAYILIIVSGSGYGAVTGLDALNTNSVTCNLVVYQNQQAYQIDEYANQGYKILYFKDEKEEKSIYNNSTEILCAYVGIHQSDTDFLTDSEENRKALKTVYDSMSYLVKEGTTVEVHRLSNEGALSKKVYSQEIYEKIEAIKKASNNSDNFIFGGSGNLIWPCSSKNITSKFGYRNAPTAGASSYHKGVDIALSSGSKVFAVSNGTVESVAYDQWRGNYVIINHGNGMKTIYEHLTNAIVSKGSTVKQGTVIGYSGSTGVSTGPHLHFGVMVNDNYVDPLNYYSKMK